MISIFIKEQERYSIDEISRYLKTDIEKAKYIIKKLIDNNVVKSVKKDEKQREMTELQEEDIEMSESNKYENYLFVFKFVGVVIVENFIFKCYPKYIDESSNLEKLLKQGIKVIEKYGRKKSIIDISLPIVDTSINTDNRNALAIMIYIVRDYLEYGPYVEEHEILEINGTGDVLWNKTINETFTLISKNKPYYPYLITKKTQFNNFDFFKRLHEAIVTECSSKFKEAEILYLFGLPEIYASDECLDDLGDKNYILYKIEQEKGRQFNTRKQLLLSLMQVYVDQNMGFSKVDDISIYGSKNFNLVWEDVCSEVLNSDYKKSFKSNYLPFELNEKYNDFGDLSEIIEKPKWFINEVEEKPIEANQTLKPDCVVISKNNEGYSFDIFDAKYYTPKINSNKTIIGQPGIEDIVKQYVYQIAYSDFIKTHNIKNTSNTFLIPSEGNKAEDMGYVKLDMFSGLKLNDKELNLNKIDIFKLPAELMYGLYLSDSRIEISELF